MMKPRNLASRFPARPRDLDTIPPGAMQKTAL